MFRWLCVLSLLLMTAGLSYATCVVPTRVVHRPAVFHKPVVVATPVVKVVEPVVTPVAVFAPLAVAVPTYTAGYNPALVPAPTAPPVAAVPQQGMSEVLLALQKLNGRLDALERRIQAPPPPQPAPAKGQGKLESLPGFLGVASAKCSQCHLKGKEGDGGGFVLLDSPNAFARLDVRQKLAVSRHLYKGSMPPRNNRLNVQPLTDEEVGVGMAYIDSLK